jgi:orotidine-5'-phosphate decarboxylase
LIAFMSSSPHLQTYNQRALRHKNPAAKLLLETIDRKKSNLAVSVDVASAKDFLAIIDAVGPFVCLIKAIIIPETLAFGLIQNPRPTSTSSMTSPHRL